VKAKSVVKERRIVEKTEGVSKLERLKDSDYIGLWGGVWILEDGKVEKLCHRPT